MSLSSAASLGRIASVDAIRNCASVGDFTVGSLAGAVAIAGASGKSRPVFERRSPSLSMISGGVAG